MSETLLVSQREFQACAPSYKGPDFKNFTVPSIFGGQFTFPNIYNVKKINLRLTPNPYVISNLPWIFYKKTSEIALNPAHWKLYHNIYKMHDIKKQMLEELLK